ncbi:MAG: glutathione S-transferase N-terminal domain-containing protein [Pseudomonadota bacterium]
MYRIIIAQKAYSSWSLRGWLLLDAFGLAYEEVLIRLYSDEFAPAMKARAPARTVPILEWEDGGQTRRVWESLAIAETLAERHPEAGIWPEDPTSRDVARIIANEMHAGFTALRTACPMNLHRSGKRKDPITPELTAEIDRAAELWSWALQSTGGPWLAGSGFSAADAFMAPLATRLESYDLIDARTEAYTARILSHPSVLRWREAALDDPERISWYDAH